MWRFKWHIAAVVVVAGAIGYGVSMLQPTLYEAKGDILLEDPRNMQAFSQEVGLSPEPQRHLAEQEQVIESFEVAKTASEILGGSPDWRGVQSAITVIPSNDNDAVTVYATQATPDAAVALVDAVQEAYAMVMEREISARAILSIASLERAKADLEVDLATIGAALDASVTDDPSQRERTSSTDSSDGQNDLIAAVVELAGPALARMGTDADLALQQETLLNRIAGIDGHLEMMRVDGARYGSGVKLYLAPSTPASPTQPTPARNAKIAAFLGLIGAAAWAWWRAESSRDANGDSSDHLANGDGARS